MNFNFFSTTSPLSEINKLLSSLGHMSLAEEVGSYKTILSEKNLRLVVFGEYSVGKSTLINALLGKRILANGFRPTTGVATQIQYGKEQVCVVFRDGKKHNMSLSEADNYSNLTKENRARDEVDRIIISTPNDILKNGITLIDTPGILDTEKQTERALRELISADIVILMSRADRLLSAKEIDFAIKLRDDYGKSVIPIVNFMGITDISDHNELRKRLNNFTRNLSPPFGKNWYEIDALPALRYFLGISDSISPDDDYYDFCSTLKNLSKSQLANIKSSSLKSWRTSLKSRASAENLNSLENLENKNKKLIDERKNKANHINDNIRRLQQSINGECLRCTNQIDLHKTGQILSVSKYLPTTDNLKTENQRKNATQAIEQYFTDALLTIDDNANKVLLEFANDIDVVPTLISIRELVALATLPNDSVTSAESGAAFGGAAIGSLLGVGAAVLTGAWIIALPIAFLGFIFGANSDMSEEIEAFRKKLCSSSDDALDKLRPLLRDQFNSRANELIEQLKKRSIALNKMPSPPEEIKMRQKLNILLNKELF